MLGGCVFIYSKKIRRRRKKKKKKEEERKKKYEWSTRRATRRVVY